VLKNELVISVSSGYLHKDYAAINPRYHCVPQITYGKITKSDVIKWFQEMHDRIGDAEVILSVTERDLVQSERLFAGRNVYYVSLKEHMERWPSGARFDLSRQIPGVQSVPIICLMLGQYMGCNEMYLLGTDHDHFLTRTYRYAFDPTILKGKDISTDEDGNLLMSRLEEFDALASLWRQYRIVGEVISRNGGKVVNATAGGELDEFERADLTDLLEGGSK